MKKSRNVKIEKNDPFETAMTPLCPIVPVFFWVVKGQSWGAFSKKKNGETEEKRRTWNERDSQKNKA